MAKHAKNPDNPGACLCGYRYEWRTRHSHPVLRQDQNEAIMTRAAAGMSFDKIAAETGLTLGIVRWIVHG